MKAIDVAKWFIKNRYDYPRNTFDGNMKLQKLLFFSQLIHVARNGELLFNDEMKAYKNGTVVNNVRLAYRDSHAYLIGLSNKELKLSQSVDETLQLTAEIFGDMSPVELSDLNHELDSWILPYNESKTEQENEYNAEKNIIDAEDRSFLEDVDKVNQVLKAYQEDTDGRMSEEINGVTFYYDPNEMEITEDILLELQSCEFPDEAYTLTIDEHQEVIVH